MYLSPNKIKTATFGFIQLKSLGIFLRSINQTARRVDRLGRGLGGDGGRGWGGVAYPIRSNLESL